MRRYRKYMSDLVATAQVNGSEAIFSIIVANEREGDASLEALREAREDIGKVVKELDAAIAAEEAHLARKPAPASLPRPAPAPMGSIDLAETICAIARAGAAQYLPPEHLPEYLPPKREP